MVMLHLLGRGQAPEWDDDKHDIDEVFAFMCYRDYIMQKRFI